MDALKKQKVKEELERLDAEIKEKRIKDKAKEENDKVIKAITDKADKNAIEE